MTNEPASPQQGKAPEPIERVVSLVMSSGMAAAFVSYAIGLVLLFLRKEAIPHTSQQYYHSLSEFFQATASGDAGPFLYLGTAFLILTPFVLVLASILTFIRMRDRRFAIIASLVLAIMITSVVIGSVFKLKLG